MPIGATRSGRIAVKLYRKSEVPLRIEWCLVFAFRKKGANHIRPAGSPCRVYNLRACCSVYTSPLDWCAAIALHVYIFTRRKNPHPLLLDQRWLRERENQLSVLELHIQFYWSGGESRKPGFYRDSRTMPASLEWVSLRKRKVNWIIIILPVHPSALDTWLSLSGRSSRPE